MPRRAANVPSEPMQTTSTSGSRKRKDAYDTITGGSPAKKSRISPSSKTEDGGVVLTCGEGDVGQLGLGPDVLERGRTALVDLPRKCVQVCAGGMHTACLSVEGDVYTFGCNDEGALGRDTSKEDSETKPGIVQLKVKIVQISAGDSHTAFLTADGQLFACGTFRDANGSIGLNVHGPQKTPVKIECPKPVVKVASGSDHIVCLTDDGQIYSAGSAEQGQLGRVAECFTLRGGRKGLPLLLSLLPVHFRGTRKHRHPKFDNVWAGTYVTFARAKDGGEIYAWGLNNYYQLGIDDMANRFVPEVVDALPSDQNWLCISSGQHHSLAVNALGQVYSFGRGTYGQLGMGEANTADVKQPTRIESLTDPCISVHASSSVSFALTKDGKVYAWGMGTSKQLGSGSEDDQFEPKVIEGKQLENKKVLCVSSGGQHTVILAQESAAQSVLPGNDKMTNGDVIG